MKILRLSIPVLLLAALCASGCGKTTPPPAPATTPPAHISSERALRLVPERLNTSGGGEPILNVYIMDTGVVEQMPIEEYLRGVLAGEMRNDWPMEALKAQAIIARTFVLKFIEDKGGSIYEGADVSTDVKEAQAYDASGINERVIQAINETSGEVITYQGALTYSWFHSHSGGVTAQAKEGLEWEGDEPPYIRSVASIESANAPEDLSAWEVSFNLTEVNSALQAMGFNFESIHSISLGEKGPSGRTLTFIINGTPVTAPSLRVRLDPARFKSTLLTDAQIQGGSLVLSGHGYGHGVGMSQWGAYELAQQGLKAEDIISRYYTNVKIENAW